VYLPFSPTCLNFYSLGGIHIMKNRTFFLTSLPLASVALGLQVVGWYCLLASTASLTTYMLMRMFVPVLFSQTAPNQPQSSDGDLFRVLVWVGLALAILSLICVTLSFCRRESGWRFISIILLALYLGTWVFLWCTSGL
jgi:hypothetical protein